MNGRFLVVIVITVGVVVGSWIQKCAHDEDKTYGTGSTQSAPQNK